MDYPCEKCLIYPICKNRTMWTVVSECPELCKYINYVKNNISYGIVHQSWQQSLLSLKRKGFL